MTREEREEAIKVIKNFPVESTGERKAVLTAIKALEQEPCDVFDKYGNYRYSSDVELAEPNTVTSMPCEDVISRQAVLDITWEEPSYTDPLNVLTEVRDKVKDLPSVNPQEPKAGHCKDCKWWKDSDGVYRRGVHAESQCPINRREVMEGMGYCFMFESQKRSDKE